MRCGIRLPPKRPALKRGLDPTVPIEETVGAIGDMITAGLVRFAGLSEVGAETVRRAHAVRLQIDAAVEPASSTPYPETGPGRSQLAWRGRPTRRAPEESRLTVE